jgi:hypothetical protein
MSPQSVSIGLELMAVLVDIAILAVLIIEFDYDKTIYEKELYKKKNKKQPAFDNLTVGEGK